MIARNLIIFMLLVLIPDIYLYKRYIGAKRPLWVKIIWWLITIIMLTFTMMMYMVRDFVPHPQTSLNIYLFLMGAFVIPKALLSLCTFIGDSLCRKRRTRRKWGTWVGSVLGMGAVYCTIYGFTLGFHQFEVNHFDYTSDQLPVAFDGYRIAAFSDIHVGSYTGYSRFVLEEAIDSINAMNADLIVFLGDIQNTEPSELYEFSSLLSSLKAKDGVLTIMGNHDYARYVKVDSAQKVANIYETERLQRSFGWKLLLDENITLHRGADSIFVAGMEGNDEIDASFGVGNAGHSVENIPDNAFTIMLVHNPNEWREKVLPETKAQLTMCGHTHGGQVELFGFRPSQLTYSEDVGMYEEDGRTLFVTKGLGGVIPMRFGVPGEVVLMTLHSGKQ